MLIRSFLTGIVAGAGILGVKSYLDSTVEIYDKKTTRIYKSRYVDWRYDQNDYNGSKNFTFQIRN